VDGGFVGEEEEEEEESVLKESSSAVDGFDGSSSWVGTGTGTGVGFVGESEPMFQKLVFLFQLFLDLVL
jgi:hypothetical protein